MTPEAISALLAKKNNAIVGVNRAAGGPQLTPVWYAWDGTTFRFSTTNDRAKYANIARDPNITLIVDDPQDGYVAAYGRAEIVEENVGEQSRPIVEKYMGDNIEQGLAMLGAPNRVLVMLRPEKLLSR